MSSRSHEPNAPAPGAARVARRTRARPGVPAEPSRAQMRRQQILDAAEQCFRERGFHNASMAEIAKIFGMSAGHIYNYFDSKEAIIAAIVERDLAGFFQRTEEMRGAGDLQGAIIVRIEPGVVDKLNRNKSALQIEVMAEAGRNPRVAAMVQSVDARVRAVLRGLLQSASPQGQPVRDLDGKVAVLMALFDGLMIRALRDPGISRPQVTRVLRTLIRSLLQS
jgi:TetR/AcrR family transcriptional repressor of uid operon